MYDILLQVNKDFARSAFGAGRGQTISDLAGASIGRTLGISRREGKDLFHAGLIVAGTAVVGVAIYKVYKAVTK